MFIILFHGKEGSSPLVKLLDNFTKFDMIFQQNGGIEPFDGHATKMNRVQLNNCFEGLFTGGEFKYFGNSPLRKYNWARFGFKARQNICERSDFIDIAKKYDVPVFILYRKNSFDFALSVYHGKGNGKPGHMQFDDKIGKLRCVDMKVKRDYLIKLINNHKRINARKDKLYDTSGMRCCKIYYEDFCSDKKALLKQMFGFIDWDISDTEIDEAIKKGCYYRKQHTDYNWVLNYEEIKDLNVC